MPESISFTATVTTDGRRRVLVPVPFDPDQAWGRKREHHVHGSVDGMADGRSSSRWGTGTGSCWGRRGAATKRRPELRAARIAEMIELLEAGHKQRPGS